jgi:peptidoglycan hydrolase CwlO-like protein
MTPIRYLAETSITLPQSDGTVLGAIALILSLVISGAGLIRSWRLDNRTAKKQDIDTVIENYRALLTESKEREKKLEVIVDDQRKQLDRSERIIDEQRITIGKLESEITGLKSELDKYRRAHPPAELPVVA